MDTATLEKAKYLEKAIKNAKENLKAISYTQSNNVVKRKSFLSFNGVDNEVEIHQDLFRIIGAIVQSDYTKRIYEMEKELEEL